MGVYAALGVAQAICNFMVSFCFSIAGVAAAKSLHGHAVHSIFRAPMAFFDTTPIGRIMNRFRFVIYNYDLWFNQKKKNHIGLMTCIPLQQRHRCYW